MTAAYVEGRNDFNSNNMTATLGRYNFGFMWAAVACLFIATVLFCAGGAADSSSSIGSGRARFGGRRKKSTRSNRDRGSFIDSEWLFPSALLSRRGEKMRKNILLIPVSCVEEVPLTNGA